MQSIFSNVLKAFTSCLMLCVAICTIAQENIPACSLLQLFELESALNGKATGFRETALGICSGKVGTQEVMIRYAKRKLEAGITKEQKGIELLKKQGWQFNLKKEGDLTVSTAISPASSQHQTFNTTASIFKNGFVVAVEVSSVDKNSMPAMDVVASLVKKAFSRFK